MLGVRQWLCGMQHEKIDWEWAYFCLWRMPFMCMHIFSNNKKKLIAESPAINIAATRGGDKVHSRGVSWVPIRWYCEYQFAFQKKIPKTRGRDSWHPRQRSQGLKSSNLFSACLRTWPRILIGILTWSKGRWPDQRGGRVWFRKGRENERDGEFLLPPFSPFLTLPKNT